MLSAEEAADLTDPALVLPVAVAPPAWDRVAVVAAVDAVVAGGAGNGRVIA
jgi:hypothetical protein